MHHVMETLRAVRRLPPEIRRVLAAAGIIQLGSVIESFLVVYLVHRGFTPSWAVTGAAGTRDERVR